MDIVKEFLESSTVHGLTYISTAKVGWKYKVNNCTKNHQTTVAKCAWAVIVCLGFIGAGGLIERSYDKWHESPIATTITTLPLADLDFPQVTVCPPKGSHSALNYDLMKAANVSFSNEMRQNMKDFIWNNLVRDQHKIYVREMLSMTTPSDIENMYYGQQSLPKPYGNTGFKITFETYEVPIAKVAKNFQETSNCQWNFENFCPWKL